MTDFHINLAKDLVSSEEDRIRFYNGMLIYLVICSVALVFTAYLSSLNLRSYLESKRARAQLIKTVSTVSGLEAGAFRNPEKTYEALETYSGRMSTLKQAINHRVQLLPVVHNLFVNLPQSVTLKDLSANRSKLAFSLLMPLSDDTVDPVRDLRKSWEQNEDLMRLVTSIRPVKGERQTVGSKSMFYVQFECMLKK